MFAPALYVQFDGRGLVAAVKPEDAVKQFPGAGQNVGLYTLSRTTKPDGTVVVADAAAPAPLEALPARLFMQVNRRGSLEINRTEQGAANNKAGDGTIGIYVRTKFVTITGNLVDIAPVAAATGAVSTTSPDPAAQT